MRRNAALSYLTTDRDRICGVSFTGSPTSCNVTHDSFGNIAAEPTRAGYNKLAYFNSGDVRTIVNQAKATATFAYDPFGELQELTIDGPTGSRHDRNFGAFITQRTQKSALASASYVARRFPGPGLSLSRRGPKGNWVYEFSEPSGTRFTTDEKGKFLQDLRYTPFGDTTSTGVPPGTDTFTTDQVERRRRTRWVRPRESRQAHLRPRARSLPESRSIAHAANLGDQQSVRVRDERSDQPVGP